MRTRATVLLLVFAVLLSVAADSFASTRAKVSIYGLRMEPRGQDAEDFSEAGWGGGLRAVLPIPNFPNFLAPTLGVEIVNLLDATTVFQDKVTGFRVEQQTSQDYGRFYIGAEIGPHGRGFVRPWVGINIAVVSYGIDTDFVVPDDRNREDLLRQNIDSERHTVFGYDINFGLDVHYKKMAVEGGVRYTESFGVTQQLGEEAVDVHPKYVVYFIGVGFVFSYSDLGD